MKRLLMGVLAAALVAGGFAHTGGPATAEQPPDVNHPECAGLVKDIAPGVATSTAGIVYVKAGDEHVNIGYQAAGYVATSPNGHGVSHVDVCPTPAKPDPIVERSFECLDEQVTVTTTTYTWLNGGWVLGTPVITTDEPTEAEVAAALEGCDPQVEFSDWIGEPTCGQAEYTQTQTKTVVPHVWNGSAFVAGTPVVTEEKRTLDVTPVEPCPTTPTSEPTAEVEVLPPTTPPANPPANQPATAVAQATPVAGNPPAVAPASTQLPETGSSQWVLALLALASLGAGAALTRLSRRSA